MRRVVIESPYAAPVGTWAPLRWWFRLRNRRYARACMRSSLRIGEAPIASHLLYTQPGVLSDARPAERCLGIDAGLAWGIKADAVAVYTDLGISPGMQAGIYAAHAAKIPVEYRRLW